jgi:Ca2+-binding EF-hand superfamily protein
LTFIKARGVSLTNIGAEDLVDKNEKLVMGMIWTLILRFSIAEITEEGLNAKEGLLLWCQRRTHGYKNVNVKDFTFSWGDGLALCALIHRHRPDLIDFDKLNKNNKRENVTLALEIAETQLNIPKLFDVEDLVDITKPDERSVMTYVAQYFHAFSSLGKVEVAGRRVGKFAVALKAAFEMQHNYEVRASKLIKDVTQITQTWASTSFASNFNGIKQQSNEFLAYKNTLKREWVSEKRDLDSLLGNIQTKLATYNLAVYSPPSGLSLADVDASWSSLLSAEGGRRKALNEKMQAIKEQLRVNYSQLANGFEDELNSISQAVGALNGELPAQLNSVNELSKRVENLNAKLANIESADRECDAAGLDESEREYTVYSVEDLVFDFHLVQSAIKKKSAFIENQIVARQNSKLTPQQLEEFESTFRAFDKNSSNTLSKLEFKACLASLGNAYEDAEFEEVFRKAGNSADEISFEKFTNFMVSITEDRTTPDQIRQSFRAIANGKNHITEVDMCVGQLDAEQVEHLKSVLPKFAGVEGGYDYEAYLKQVFP